MIEKILDYSGIIFAVVGIICLFLEAFATLKRKSNPKLVIAGMVCLAVSVIGFIVTDVILRDAGIPSYVTAVWIALLWAYLICNLVSAVIISRKKRLNKGREDEQDVDGLQTDEQICNVTANDSDAQSVTGTVK